MYIKDTYGNRVGDLRGDEVFTPSSSRVGQFRGDDFYTASGGRVGQLRGSDVYSVSGSRIGQIRGSEIYSASGSRVGWVDGSPSNAQLAAAAVALLSGLLNASASSGVDDGNSAGDENHSTPIDAAREFFNSGTEKTNPVSREDLMRDFEQEKRQKKILLICSAVCSSLGLVIGVISGVIWHGDMEGIFTFAFAGLWIGTGFGGTISYLPGIPYAFSMALKEEGFGGAIKTTLIGIFVWFFGFMFLGPIGLLVRVLMKNHRIKKLAKLLAAGQYR